MVARIFGVLCGLILGSAANAQDPTLKSIRFGTPLSGKPMTADDLKGKVVLVEQWAVGAKASLDIMPTLVRWHDELADGGFVLLGIHVPEDTADNVRMKCRELNVRFPVTIGGGVTGIGGGTPYCLLFDHNGKVMYEGHPNKVEPKLREAIVGMLSDDISESPTKSLNNVFDGYKKGTINDLNKKISALKGDADPKTAKQAKTIADKFLAGGQAKFDEAKAAMKDDPIGSYESGLAIAARWKGTSLGKSASDLADKLKTDKLVAAELKARPSLDKIFALDAALIKAAKEKKIDPDSPEFKTVFAGQLKQIEQAVGTMKKNYPDAPATKQAEEIAKRLGATGAGK